MMPERTLRCGIAGFGFIGPHHLDAIRRIPFAEVTGICTSTLEGARQKAAAMGIAKAYEDYHDLVRDPAIDVVDITAPTYLHFPIAMEAIRHRKHVIVDKPLAISVDECAALLQAAQEAGVVHAITFNYRYNAMVQQARAMIQRGDLGPIHFVQGSYLQEWLLRDSDFSWRLDPLQSGPAAMMADAGCHWFDLVEYVIGLRISSVLANLTTVIPVRKGPDGAPYEVKVPDLGTMLLRFSSGAAGSFSTSSLCAGHKNDLRFEFNGSLASLSWAQEEPEKLWIGRRGEADAILRKDPAVLDPSVRGYATLPGGHGEAWPDAFRNTMANIFSAISAPGEAQHREFPTFASGLRVAHIIDALLKSSEAGGVWTEVPG
jgi:predicted dehydrogenase